MQSDRIARRLKPRDLQVFLKVAEDRNMAKAAKHLAISRPGGIEDYCRP
jgi:hypothetical protein